MTLKKYTLGLLAIVFALLTLTALFNRVVDPFWYFRDIEINGFNVDKPHFSRNERLVKGPLLKKLQPDAIIMGSSYAEVGLPPTHAGFSESGQLRTYNLALSGAGWPEVYCYAMYAMDQAPLKRLVLGLSAAAGDATCSSYGDLSQPDYVKLLFSKNALDASFVTLRRQNDGKPRITREGLWYFNRFNEKIRTDDDIANNFAYEISGQFCTSPGERSREIDYARINKLARFSEQESRGLRAIIRTALRKNIRLVLFTYPKHVLSYEVERMCDRLVARWNHLRQIVALVDEETRTKPGLVEVWDFYGYREANAERVHAGKNMSDRLWQDSGHFNHEVGSILFDKIFSGVGDYGVKVTSENFDSLFPAAEYQRRNFLRQRPWIDDELIEVARLAGAKMR